MNVDTGMENSMVIMAKPSADAHLFLIQFTHRDEATGVTRSFGIEVVDGAMVSVGDLPPDEAATMFFESFKERCGGEFLRMAAGKFNSNSA